MFTGDEKEKYFSLDKHLKEIYLQQNSQSSGEISR